MKRIKALFLAVCMLASVALFAACGDDTQGGANSGTDAAYKVSVVDGSGNPYTSGVIVRFLKDGVQAAMQKVGENGVAEKTLAKDDYTVELMFTDSADKYHYEKEGLTLSADKTELQIVLYYTAAQSQTLSAQGKEYEAYRVATGSTYVNLTAGDRSYFLFSPTEAGTYQFSAEGEGVQIGYYGAPHFVQETNVAEDLKDNTFTQSITAGMIGTDGTGTATLVIGIDSDAADSCVLSVERIGDPAWSLEDEPWTEYVCKNEIKPFTLDIKDGQKLTYVDIRGKTEDYNIVLNETDGYYHLNTADGPVIYINLGKDAPNASLQTVIMGDGAAGGAPIRHYFFDENNKFIKKEDYTNILTNYFDNMDENYKVYPLNEDLVYIITNACSGWWTSSDPNYIFDGCNPDLGWLFACCYIEG